MVLSAPSFSYVLLMLGATSAITADVQAIPLFWVLPLAVYLGSFVLVFAKKPPIPHRWVVKRLPFLLLVGLCPAISQTRLSLAVLLLVYLTVLLGLALAFHGELARSWRFSTTRSKPFSSLSGLCIVADGSLT